MQHVHVTLVLLAFGALATCGCGDDMNIGR
jgi:hypothetical protein